MLGINFDPLVTSGLAGFAWPLIQAAFDQPHWTAARRRWLALAAGIALTVIIWLTSAYPATWQAFTTQAGVVIGTTSAAFTILKQAGVIDWVGRVTPGGEVAQPKHAEDAH